MFFEGRAWVWRILYHNSARDAQEMFVEWINIILEQLSGLGLHINSLIDNVCIYNSYMNIYWVLLCSGILL